MRTSVHAPFVLSHTDVKRPASCVILLLNALALRLCKGRNEEGEKAFSLLPCCAVMRCYFVHSNENNDITIDIIPPNIVARKSSLLNSESHISLTNPHRTETFVPMIEYRITFEILHIKHNIKVTDNAIVAPAKKWVILSIPTFSVIFVIKLFICINVL